MTRQAARLVLVVLGAFAATAAPAAAQSAVALAVQSAAPNVSDRTITITGERFGTRPFVTLNLVPLNVQSATDTRIVAVAPIDMMPPDTYLLTVSRGLADGESGSLEITLGTPVEQPAAAVKPAEALEWPSGSEPAARVGDRVITVDDVDAEWQRTDPGSYLALHRDVYENRRRVLEQMVTDELLAREAESRGLTIDALLDEEIPKRVVTMPDSAVLSLYESLGDRTRGASLDQMRPALRAWLERRTEPELAKMTFIEELTKVSTRADVLLPAPRVTVEHTSRDATLGPASAPVEIVAFGDFQNADYARLARAFGSVREHFGDRVRFVFKPLPVLGPDSATAAEAAACAQAQGGFWAYHDRLLTEPGPFGPIHLKQVAEAAGLDRTAFDACLDGGTFRDLAREALEEAQRYAVRSSPSFLVNGVLAADAPPFLPPFEYFTRLIEQELLRQSKASPGR